MKNYYVEIIPPGIDATPYYFVEAECSNCGIRGNFHVKKGLLVKGQICYHCDCPTLQPKKN